MQNSAMPGKVVTTETRLLSAQIRTGDPKAIRRVVTELKRAKGNVVVAAGALGIAWRTLLLWRDANEDFAAAYDEHARSRGRPSLPKPKVKKKTKAKVPAE